MAEAAHAVPEVQVDATVSLHAVLEAEHAVAATLLAEHAVAETVSEAHAVAPEQAATVFAEQAAVLLLTLEALALTLASGQH